MTLKRENNATYRLYNFMIKKLHYIKNDYSGEIEKFCLETHKKLYPDFEFLAWKPGSSPLRILYDHGGLFIGPNFFSVSRIPDSYFEKPFIVFDNTFDTLNVDPNICCYSDAEESPLFLEFMEKGIYIPLGDKINSQPFRPCLNETDFLLDRLNIYNKNQFGMFDRTARKIFDGDGYICSTNTNISKALDFNLHYKVVDKDTDSNELFIICENFCKLKEGKHFLLLLFKMDGSRDLINRMSDYLNYSVISDDKDWDIIIGDENILPEYIGKKFDGLKSCERV